MASYGSDSSFHSVTARDAAAPQMDSLGALLHQYQIKMGCSLK